MKKVLVFAVFVLTVFIFSSCEDLPMTCDTELKITSEMTIGVVVTPLETEVRTEPTETIDPADCMVDGMYYVAYYTKDNAPLIKEGADISKLECGMTYREVMEILGPGLNLHAHLSYSSLYSFRWKIDDENRVTIVFGYAVNDKSYLNQKTPDCDTLRLYEVCIFNIVDNEGTIPVSNWVIE